MTKGESTVSDEKKGHKVALIGTPGCGKAQPLDARVLTPTGWVLMGEIKIGDEVVNPEGGVAKVVGLFPQGVRDIYRLTFSDGSSTECDLDHLWTTRTRNYEPWTTKPLSAFLREDGTLKRNRRYIPMVSKFDFTCEDNLPIDPYLLGLLLGDGSFGPDSISLTTADEEIIEKLNVSALPAGVSIKKKGNSSYGYALTRDRLLTPESRYKTGFAVKENTLLEGARLLGLEGLKSHEKFVPHKYKFTTYENRLAILQGLMDSDGGMEPSESVKKSGYVSTAYGCSFTSTSKQLALDVQFLIQSLGGRARVRERTTSYTHKGVKRAGRVSYRLNVSLPPETVPFRLNRKSELWGMRQYSPSRRLVEVAPIGKKLAQCIALDSDNQLYVTDDFIVTHNTTVAQALQASMSGTDFIVATCSEYARDYIQKYGTIEHPAIQSSILRKQLRREDILLPACDLLITDSPVFFNHIYTTLMIDPSSKPQRKIARDIYKWGVLDQLENYDCVIYLPKQFDVVDDGVRDPEAHEDIENVILGFIGVHKHLFKDYVEIRSELTDPKEILQDRVKMISRHLKKTLDI